MKACSKHIYIGGMTCDGCRSKIENKLKNTEGVLNAAVSLGEGTADVSYNSEVIKEEEILELIKGLGYDILTEGEEGFDIGRGVCLLVIIVSLYYLLQLFGVLNFLAPGTLAESGMGYGMLFAVGVFTSVHCIAMCGGINLSQCIPRGADKAAFMPALTYNFGRVASYTLIGFILGFAGMLFGGTLETGASLLLQGVVKIVAGVFMIIMGINMLGIFPWMRRFGFRLPRFLVVKIGRKSAESRRPFVVGLLNGLMPCGPLQAMELVALSAGSPFYGALAMLAFGLGTVPLMLGLGSLVAALGKRFSQAVLCVGAVLVAVLGLAMVTQGVSLSGLFSVEWILILVIALCIVGIAVSIFDRSRLLGIVGIGVAVFLLMGNCCLKNGANGLRGGASAVDTAEIVDGVQVVYSELGRGSYPDISVSAGIPVKWVIYAPEGSVNGCNYKMLLSEYGIEYEFEEGENVIEFLPKSAGTVQYSCWMGMISGNIYVSEQAE